MSIAEEKDRARKAAFARRASADRAVTETANRHLIEAVRDLPGTVVSAYWPIRTELDPRPAMHELAKTHDLCLPVVLGAARPLGFRPWVPGAAMEAGAFGAQIPVDERSIVPGILIVPLAAFDRQGYRLGYGGGFYDRTLEQLKARGPVCAIGFAYDAQECDGVPRDATDQQLDAIVTESGIHQYG